MTDLTKPPKGHRRIVSAPVPVRSAAREHADDDATKHSSVSKCIPTSIAFLSADDEVSNMRDIEEMRMSFDVSHPAKWAITFNQLLEVHAVAEKMYGTRYGRKTMRDINQDIIIPQCQASGTSYALAKNASGHKVGAFITHCWDEPFHDFVKSIRAAFHHFPVKPNLWICAFALVQGDKEIVAEQLEMPLEESPFVLALREATWFVVVRNSKRDLYSRIWCVCELFFAKKFGFTTSKNMDDDAATDDETNSKNSTMVIGPDFFSASRTSCVGAEASDSEDKRRILELLQAEHTVEEVDALVLQYRKHGILPSNTSNRRKRTAAIVSLLLVALAVGTAGWLSVFLSPSDSPTSSDPAEAPTLVPTSLPTPTRTSAVPTSVPTPTPTRTSAVPTFVPGEFLENLPDFTRDALTDEFSSQTRALNWSLAHPDYAFKEEWKQSQLFVLVTFYYSYSGDKWSKYGDWLSFSVPECSWSDASGASIICNEYGRVTRIILDRQGDGVSGGTPPEVSLLTSLERLEISRMDDLNTPFEQVVPSQLSNLTNLTDLILTDNSITGSLPSYLGGFQKLTDLNLKDNEIGGELPTEIGLMTRLEGLKLLDNEIAGRVPTEFGVLSSLKALNIQKNNLIGELPKSICELSSLSVIKVDCSKITCPPGCKCCPTTPPTSIPIVDGLNTDAPTEGTFPDYDPSSPQYTALDWLMKDPRYDALEQWQKDQLFAMAAFYYSYNGDNWSDNQKQNWLSQTPECTWGITGDDANKCNIDGRITRLGLESQADGIAGTTPPELSLLSSLKEFHISHMELHTDLTQVMPLQLASLQNLTQTSFEFAHLNGSLPTYLGDFQGLTNLSLGNNEIMGQIATEIGLLGRLQFLFLDGNSLSGAVPTELGMMSSLVTLHLHDNHLNGTLPAAICLLPSLQSLTVDCLKIDCPIECDCECRDPADLGDPGTNSPSPTSSSLAAPNPSPSEELGLTPYPTSGPGSYALNLPEYSVEAFEAPLSAQSVAYEWLIDHPDLGSMPEWKKQQLFALVTFYHAFAGDSWSVYEKQNWLNYTVDECEWVSADTTDPDVCDVDGRILELSIQSAQGFNGLALPPEIGLLSSLEAFKLYRLDDFIADLSDILPTQLAYLPLKTLFVYDTQVYGSIPTQLSYFRSLTNLDLRSNALTGSLPSELGLLSKLRFLTLYGNALDGKIPSELGLLTSIESLLLDRTQVTGTLPVEVCSLSSLLLLRVNCSLVVNCTACEPCSCYTET